MACLALGRPLGSEPRPLQAHPADPMCSCPPRTPEDLSRFIVELQQRELALKDRNSSITSR